MSFTYKNYTLNSYLADPWYPTEIALFQAILDKLPDADKTYVSSQHYHSRIAQPASGANVLFADDLGKLNIQGYTAGFLFLDDLGVVSATGISGGYGATGQQGIQGVTGPAGTLQPVDAVHTAIPAFTGASGALRSTSITVTEGAFEAMHFPDPLYFENPNGNICSYGATGLVNFMSTFNGDNVPAMFGNNQNVPDASLYSDGSAFVIKEVSNTKIVRQDTGALGAKLELQKVKTSPAKGEDVSDILMTGKNSAGSDQIYGRISAQPVSPAAGSEYGSVLIRGGVPGNAVVNVGLQVQPQGGVIALNSQMTVSDTALYWTANKSIAFGIETGIQNTDADESGCCGKIEQKSAIAKGGLKVSGFSQDIADIALELIGHNEGESGTEGSIVLRGEKFDGGTGLTVCDSGEVLVGIVNHNTVAMNIFGNGDTVTVGHASAAGMSGVTGIFDYLGTQGSFTIGFTGLGSGTSSGTAKYVKQGRQVTLYVPAMTGTSNSTQAGLYNIPTTIKPTVNQAGGNPMILVPIYDNNAQTIGVVTPGNSDYWPMLPNATGGSTTGWNSGSVAKGISATVLTYFMD